MSIFVSVTPFFVYIIVGALGLIIGSYLNSWVWRVHERQWRLGGRSKCVHCSRPLTWWENVPLVSYLILRGQCRTCHGPIPVDYFLVELFTPLTLCFITYHHLAADTLNPWLYFRDIFFSIVLISVFVYDYKYMEIRSGVVYGGTLVALAINYAALHLSPYSLLLGLAIGAGIFLLQYLVSKGRWIGGGDVRLGLMMGALLGSPTILFALFVAYVTGTIVAVPLLITKKKGMNSEVPFGTFLAVGAMAALVWGQGVVEWYQALVRW